MAGPPRDFALPVTIPARACSTGEAMATMRDEVQVHGIRCGGRGLLDAVRALSAQSGRDAVLRTLAPLVLELGGARRAVLIGIDDRGPVVEAIARIKEGGPQIRMLRAAPAAHGVAPEPLAMAWASSSGRHRQRGTVPA